MIEPKWKHANAAKAAMNRGRKERESFSDSNGWLYLVVATAKVFTDWPHHKYGHQIAINRQRTMQRWLANALTGIATLWKKKKLVKKGML